MKIKKAIVTGGCGFIGSHLVDALVAKKVKVTVIDKKKPRKSIKREEVKYKLLDVQSPEAFEVVEKEQADVVFHLAAQIQIRESIAQPVVNAQNNLFGTLNILDAVRKAGIGKFVLASTAAVYGNDEQLPVPENIASHPPTPYGISKYAAELYVHFYEQTLNVPGVTLRFANVYGPRQDSSAESGAIGVFTTSLLRGEQAAINNDGLSTRDYVFVEDVVRALILAAESDATGVFNIGTGIETSTNQLFELVRDEVGSQATADYREEVQDQVKHSALDAMLARKKLKWRPEVELKDGLEKTVAWYRENI